MSVYDSSQCPHCGAVCDAHEHCAHYGSSRAAPVDVGSRAGDRDTERRAEEDVFATPEARSVAEQLAALVAGQIGGATTSPGPITVARVDSDPDRAGGSKLPRPRRATSPMIGNGPRRRAIRARADRQRRRLVVGVVALGVTLAGMAIAQVIAQEFPGSRNDSETAAGSPTGSLVSGAGQGDPTLDQVRCWDGSAAFGLEGCGEPAGFAGLIWIYPTLPTESCEPAGGDGGRQTWACPVTTRSGAEAEIVYRELFSVAKALTYYSGKYADGLAQRKARSGRYIWKATDTDQRGVWQISSMYVEQPWAVHVEAATKKAARQAFQGIEFRPADDVRGISPTR